MIQDVLLSVAPVGASIGIATLLAQETSASPVTLVSALVAAIGALATSVIYTHRGWQAAETSRRQDIRDIDEQRRLDSERHHEDAMKHLKTTTELAMECKSLAESCRQSTDDNTDALRGLTVAIDRLNKTEGGKQ